jgi:alkanesulfonate monooxygenase SsuD/methylene tetrahydromethanopterin reductase-like flavin-dependent oxidoreductase (luciferase family)
VPIGGELPEHYGRWCDPFVALSIAASVTKWIKLASGFCLLPEREPLITAKTIASLDLYSGGRAVLGVGAGWLREETEAMGAHFGSRWKRLRETVEAMRVAWSAVGACLCRGNHSLPARQMRSETAAEALSADPLGWAHTESSRACSAHL